METPNWLMWEISTHSKRWPYLNKMLYSSSLVSKEQSGSTGGKHRAEDPPVKSDWWEDLPEGEPDIDH